ncbi:protein of unknown function, partial [Streptomyces sp. DfronAA-171]
FEWLPPLDLPGPGRQRRWTVLLRLPLLLPHAVVLFFLSLAAFFTAIAGWFAALVLGRLPEPVFRYLAAYLAYEARVGASAMLLVDRYPPFALFRATGYEVRFENRPTHLDRLAVLFRIVLIIPAWIIASLVMSGWWTLGLLWWLITLVLGRMPLALHGASTAALRYHLRTSAYWLLLTPAYPKRFFGDEPGVTDPVERYSATRPLPLSTGGKWLLVLFLVAGVVGGGRGSTYTSPHEETDTARPGSTAGR